MIWNINFQMFSTYSKSVNEPWRTILTCLSPFDTYVNGCKKRFHSSRSPFFFSHFDFFCLIILGLTILISHVFFLASNWRVDLSLQHIIFLALYLFLYWTRSIKKNKKKLIQSIVLTCSFFISNFTTIFSYIE